MLYIETSGYADPAHLVQKVLGSLWWENCGRRAKCFDLMVAHRIT